MKRLTKFIASFSTRTSSVSPIIPSRIQLSLVGLNISKNTCLLDRLGAPDAPWFHTAQYLAGVHSMLSNPNLPDKMTPKQYHTGITPNISPWLQFTFWQPILFFENENSWPSSKERCGYWPGVAENIGDFLTYWIFDDQSKKVVARRVVQPYTNNWTMPLVRPRVECECWKTVSFILATKSENGRAG